MSFLFASSHLPAVRSTRPELEEEEEENVNPESLPRSGGVRASSHLEERAPDSARRADGSPAPRRADAASDWLGRLKELAEQQRTRSAPAAPDDPPRRADAEHEPDAEPDHDADEAPGAKSDEAPEHENTRSWHQSPESGSYHPDHGFDQHPPEGEEKSGRDSWGDGAPPSAQDWRVRRSDESQGQPPGGQRSVGPGVPPGSGPASGRTAAFPNSRLFEMRPHPALAGMTGAGSSPEQRAQCTPNQSLSNLQGLFPNAPAAPISHYAAQAKTGPQQSRTASQRQQEGSPTASPSGGRRSAQTQESGGDSSSKTPDGEGPFQPAAGAYGDDKKSNPIEPTETGALFQKNKIIHSSSIPASQRGLAVLREFFNPDAKNIHELYDSMRKALAGDKALILHVNSNGEHSAIIAIHLDENGDLVNTLYDPSGSYKKETKGTGDVMTNKLPATGQGEINWSLADFIRHHAADGSMSFVPIWTDGDAARRIKYIPGTMGGFCALSCRDVIQQLPGFTKSWGLRPVTPTDLSDQLHRIMGRKITIQHKP